MAGACRKNGRQCNAEEMLKGRLSSKRRKGRPRMRWLDDVESNLKMDVKGWKEMRDREQWRLVVVGIAFSSGSPIVGIELSPSQVVPRVKR
jgi:hypothetical protein